MKKLLLILFLVCYTFAFSQSKSFWQKQAPANFSKVKPSKQDLPKIQTYSLNLEGLKQVLVNAPERGEFNGISNVIVDFPNSKGELESFRIIEAPVLHPALEIKYPGIKSYAGQGIEDPTARIRFSVSPLGLQSMRLSAYSEASFIEPYTNDLSQYTIYTRSDKTGGFSDFECEVMNSADKKLAGAGTSVMKNADDAILRTYRLAVSATGEYTQYHGGTKALALAAINTTMTRVNGIYESDFNVTMVLIANTDDVIYTSTSSDPYASSTSGYNSALQSTLTSVIGESNYDIGHLFANLQNNGNAGCIGCVCVNNQKGSGWTSHTVPEGDNFDVDYVAHEMGHQFGGNHTFTFSNEGTGVQMEPGSGSTIMGYAGITGATDVQAHSDPYFHAVSIEQITDYIKSTSCQTNTSTGNAVPAVNAGANYTIPKGTPFVLEGTAIDADTGDVLTYCWEQFNSGSPSTTNPSVNNTSGTAFRSFNPTTDSKRYFPRLSTVKTGATSWQWEAIPNVARTLTFRLTVRDNVVGGGNNNSDDTVITVNGTAGPFVVNVPNTNVTWNAGTTQTVTWNVAGTTGNGVNAANVDIFLSTDGGDTYPISLAAGVTNDGSHDIVVPNNQGSQNRIMVKGSNHVFFDISNSDFTIAGQVACNATVPTGLAASNIATTSATLSWDAVPGGSFDLQYREVGSGTWTTLSVTGISSALTGLTALTQYEAQVRSKCPDTSTSAYSAIVNFTTTDVQLNYCSSASTNVNDEYISRVQLNTIDNSSGAQFYSDFSNISTTLTKDTQYTITVTPTWTGTVYNEAYSVWIDYNRDGDFTDSGEQVWTQGNTQATSVSGNFTVPTSAVENSTRMRVSMKYNGIPTACETFTYGEVEDYTVIIEGSGPDIEAPSAPTNLSASNTTQTSTDLSWNASTDNVGVTDYDVYQGSTVIATISTTNYQVTGLLPSTAYAFSVVAKDAAGNESVASNVANVTTLDPPDIQAPTAPTNLVASNTTQTTTDLSWDASNDNIGVTGYDVYQGAALITSVSGLTYHVTGLSPNTSYSFSVRAKDAAGNISGDSNIVNVTTDVFVDSTPPSTPANLGASNTTQTATDLNWTASTDNVGVSSYDVYQGVTLIANVAISNYQVTGLTASTSYSFSVVARDAAGNESAASNAANVTTLDPPDTQAPTAPTSLVASNTTQSSTDLNWTASTDNVGVTAYDVYQGATVIATVAVTNYQVTGLSSNTGYNFSIKAKDAAGNESASSNVVNVTTLDVSGCSGGITSYPYNEGFENTLGAWTQSTADDLNWIVDANGTPSSNTGPSSASEGTYYIYVEASGNGTGYPNKRAILNSPCFDLSLLSDAEVTFKYHMYGSNDMGTIDLEISDDDGVTWTSIWNQSGNKGNTWNTANLDLAAYSGSNIQLRFNRFVGGTWQADIAIDDFSISVPAIPTCSDGIQNGDETGVDCGGSSCAPCSTSDVVLNEGYFETGWDGWIDGGSDAFRYSGSRSYEGNYSIRLRDNTSSSTMTLQNIDVTPYSQVVVDFYFYVYSMENNEDFWLQFYDGSSYITVGTWTRGVNINNNTFYNATITLTPAQYNFASNSGFRFRCDASGNSDYIYIDQVTITGTTSAKGEINDLIAIRTMDDKRPIFEGDFMAYPNPVKGNLLNVKLPEGDAFTYSIVNMFGQTIKTGKANKEINVEGLKSGVYFIKVNDGEEIMTKKFIRE